MKSAFIKVKNWFSSHVPTRRRIIQLYAALLFNANLKGYITGDIFKGITKNVCTPGLNCYSCPGAVTACPMGALQNALSDSGKRTPYYMLGIIMLYGLMLGRWICGWLCPTGLFQDLLYKIKTPKLKKNRATRVLSYFKYVVLVFFGVIIPLMYAFRDFPLPAFCKYICPAGTLGGAIGLLINPSNTGMFGMLGPLFTWKFVLMISFVVGSVFIYRLFCRFVCPLGALYSLFNKVALLGIRLDRSRCVDCGKCISVCKMDINHVGDHECIHCGDCVGVCPTKAISWKGGKIILPENEIEAIEADETLGEQERREALAAVEAKRERRIKLLKTVTASVMAVVLAGSLIYFNFLHKEPEVDVLTVGDSCYAEDLELVGGGGTVNVDFYQGKIVVINFWGTWCGPCKAELPHFDELAREYAEDVVVIAVHTESSREEAPTYIEENYPDSDIVWVYDKPLDQSQPDLGDFYYTTLGGSSSYPMTVILDGDGTIQFVNEGSMTYEDLVLVVEMLKGE